MIGMDFKDCIPVCRKACYGEKISLSKKKINYGGIHSSTSYQCVNLTKTKKRYVLITADKKDCMTMLPAAKSKISILSNGGDENDISSGVILLMFAVLPADTTAINAKNWNKDMVTMIKRCKKNVLPTYDHHGTSGECYSFGNRPVYKNTDGSTVGIYVNKKSTVLSRQAVIDKDLLSLDKHLSSLINGGVDELKRFLPETGFMLAPIINTAYEVQNVIQRKILTPLKVTNSGSWNTHIFINGCTERFHAEKDCAYTCIHVPKQDLPKKRQLHQEPAFLVQLNGNQNILLPLTRPVSFMYNAQLISHRQVYYPECNDNQPPFINVSSYANKKLFDHLRKSFNRIIE